MYNAVAVAAKIEATGYTYSVFARNADVQLVPLAENVNVVLVDTRFCGCFDDGCYYCSALDEAIWDAAWEADLAEQEERWASRYATWWED